MKIKSKYNRSYTWKNIISGLLSLSIISVFSVGAKGFEPSIMPSSGNLQVPLNFKIEDITKRPKINTKDVLKAQGKIPVVKISSPKGGKLIREIDYFNNDEIVIPLVASLAYDGKGNNLPGSSLSWSYSKAGSAWTSFGNGQNVQLKLRPDSTAYVNNTIYKVNVRLIGKDPKSGLTSTDSTTLTIQAIAK